MKLVDAPDLRELIAQKTKLTPQGVEQLGVTGLPLARN